MKTPAPPPDFATLMEAAIAAGRLPDVIAEMEPQGSVSYLAWDKLRYKTPPVGLSHDEWWLATKLTRRASAKLLPTMRQLDGTPFSYVLSDEVLEGTEFVNRHASGRVAGTEQVTSPATRDRYLINSLIEEAITSSQLEGASTSRRDAKEMIREGRAPRDRGEKMILNNFSAMQRIVDLKNEELTPALVCEIHRIVTDGTLDDPAGAGRIQGDDSERVAVYDEGTTVLHQPPPVAELPGRLEALCAFANGETPGGFLPPALRAITVHFMVGYDHYFEDGNGRTARALFYWTLLHYDFWLTEYLTISRILRKAPSRYAQSFLLTEQDDGDLTYFFVYHLSVIKRAIEDLHVYLAGKAAELAEFRELARGGPADLNHRQIALLEHAIRNPGQRYTVASHGDSHRVSAQAARNDLHDLEDRGMLRRSRLGRQHAWSAVPDLAARLSSAN